MSRFCRIALDLRMGMTTLLERGNGLGDRANAYPTGTMSWPHPSSRTSAALLHALLMCTTAWPALAFGADGDPPIRISELLINPLGTDRGQEFIELSGPPGGSLAGIALVVIEGDATATSSTQKGRIDNVIDMSAHSIGSGGLILLRDGIGVIDCDPGPGTAGPLPGTRVVIFPSSSTVSGFGNGAIGLENSSSTFLLVSGFSGSVGQDLDTDNDGTLDELPWTSVLDAVSVINSSAGPIALAVGYAPQFGGSTLSALVTGFDIPMLVRRDDATWVTAPVIGVNPTTGPPITGDSGPYFWQPDREHPALEGFLYHMTPGWPNGSMPNGQSPCGSHRVTVTEGTTALWNSWGYPALDLTGSSVQFDPPSGGSIQQAVGAAVRVSFTAPVSCRYRFDLCLSEIEDTVMAAMTSCGDPATTIAVNDDAVVACGPGTYRSALDLPLGAGQSVELAIGSFMAEGDQFPLEVGAITLRIRRDSDSDGVIDEDDGCPSEPGLVAPRVFHVDADTDGYGGPLTAAFCSLVAPGGHSANDLDCDDGRPDVYWGAPERCADLGTDNDCDHDSNDADDKITFYLDVDGDGFGDSAFTVEACVAPPGYVPIGGDGCPFNPFARWPVYWHIDFDGDLYGHPDTYIISCIQPSGHIPRSGDCDDTRAHVHPGAQEVCDALDIDEDCDGVADDADPSASGRIAWYPDADGDGYGSGSPVSACDPPAPSYSALAGDCDDDPDAGGAEVNPGATERCNGVDDDCRDGIDNGLEFRDYYLDSDGDGYGDDSSVVNSCAAPGEDWVLEGGDLCLDDPAKVAPGACGCGVADSDGDGDSVADCIDNCSDLYNPGQGDCDTDGYGDACAIASGAADCNLNGVPDACDISTGASADADGDSQPDECQPDCNGNARPDAWEVAQGLADDCNLNGIPDDCEDGSVRGDTGNMGALAAGTSVTATLEGHMPATTTVSVRVDVIADMADPDAYVALALNGIAVAADLGAGAGAACPMLPIAFEIDVSAVLWTTVIDAADVPGTVTVTLAGGEALGDEACSNGLSRVRISYGGSGYDCDGNGEPDLCQLAAGEGDCDENGTFDACEAGGAGDSDSDGIPDSCERARGDFNLDGYVDGVDLAILLGAWGSSGSHEADLNGDGDVAGEDLAMLLASWGTVVH